MAIVFPDILPIEWFPWAKRLTDGAKSPSQLVHVRDIGSFQFNDATYDSHRVVVLDSTRTPTSEIATIATATIDSKNVTTFTVDYNDVSEVGDTIYLGIADANFNRFMQNYLPNGDFAVSTPSSDFFDLSGGVTITGGDMVFNDTDTTATATHDLPLFVGKEYIISGNISSITGTGTMAVKNGATTITTRSTTGTFGATFTATDSELSFLFTATGAATVTVNWLDIELVATSVLPDWISSPFCVKDIENTTSLIHGCANNDYFACYFETTSLKPILRVKKELYPADSVQDTETTLLTDGSVNNHFVQNQAIFNLRTDWLPAYVTHFFKTVFYLDASYVDNVRYNLFEEVRTIEDTNAPRLKAFECKIFKKDGGMTFKRIFNDPSVADCEIESGAYYNSYFGEDYTRSGTTDKYYPSQ